MKRLALLSLSFACFVGAVDADYYVGAGGHYYQHGSSVPYYRTQVYNQGYSYQQGCYTYYQQPYYSYSYYAVPNYTPPAATPAAKTDWRSQLLKIAAEKQEHNEYMEAVRALGLTVPNVQYGGAYGTYSSLNLGYYGSNANTVYGYPAPGVDLSTQFDVNAAFQQAARLAEGARTSADGANSGFLSALTQSGTNSARVAEINAQRDLAVAVIRASQEQKTVIQKQRLDFGPTPPGKDQAPPPGKVDAGVEKLWQQSAMVRCAGCHGGKDATGKVVLEAKYNIFLLPAADADVKALTLERINSSDPAKRMPKGKDPMTAEERQLWGKYLSQ